MRHPATFLSLLIAGAFLAADQTPAKAQQENPGSPGTYAPGPSANPSGATGDSSMNPNAESGKTGRSSRSETAAARRVREAIEGTGAAGESASAATPSVKNLKVFEKGGKIYLKGTVDSQADKDAIGAKASTAAGVMPVVNRLHVRMLKK